MWLRAMDTELTVCVEPHSHSGFPPVQNGSFVQSPALCESASCLQSFPLFSLPFEQAAAGESAAPVEEKKDEQSAEASLDEQLASIKKQLESSEKEVESVR